MASGLLDGRVAVVTGAGNGIGRGEALALAAEGAAVVVNDLGVGVQGVGRDRRPADVVADSIRSAGGRAVANHDDVGDWTGARSLVQQAVREFGHLDILVNNAGIQLPGSLFDVSEADLDATVHVHLKGTIATMHHAANYWRAEANAGHQRRAAVINTTSAAAIPGDAGMPAYVAAKAGVAGLTVASALELHPYGIRVNAIAPFGFTRLVEFNLKRTLKRPRQGATSFDATNPDNNAPLVVWLASDESRHVTGQVFRTKGGVIIHYTPWQPRVQVSTDGRWDPLAIGEALNAVAFNSRPQKRDPEPEIRALIEASALAPKRGRAARPSRESGRAGHQGPNPQRETRAR